MSNRRQQQGSPQVNYQNYNPQGQPSQDYGQGPNQNPYYIKPKDSFKVTTTRTKIIEAIMILTPVTVGLVLFGFTFWDNYRDNIKQQDMQSVIAALRLFYENSSNIESSRVYPLALDSNLNEIDYEYTLQRHLTGQTKLERHAFIEDGNFPTDPWGVYSQDFVNRPVPFNRLETLPFDKTRTSYIEGFSSCNFNSSQKEYPRCYIYTSSGSGDSFSLGYYSEVRGGFVVYSETRNNADKTTVRFMPV